jgi:hypothetical protein
MLLRHLFQIRKWPALVTKMPLAWTAHDLDGILQEAGESSQLWKISVSS